MVIVSSGHGWKSNNIGVFRGKQVFSLPKMVHLYLNIELKRLYQNKCMSMFVTKFSQDLL